MLGRLKVIFRTSIAAALLLIPAEAKTIDNLTIVKNLQKKQVAENLSPKQAAKQMLETIDQLYINMPPGSMSKEIQADLWFLKGQSYTTLLEYEKAEKAFDEVIKYDPRNLNSYSNIAYILNQQGRYAESIQLSDYILGINNSFINGYINKGYGFIGLARYEEAINNFEIARQLDVDNIIVYLGYAKCYAGLKQHKKAVEVYDLMIDYFNKSNKGESKADSPQLVLLKKLRNEQADLKIKSESLLTNHEVIKQ